MPWDQTSLHLARYNRAGELENSRVVAGGNDESVVQPVWSPKGKLYYLSDQDGYWNLYRGQGKKKVSWEESRAGETSVAVRYFHLRFRLSGQANLLLY